MPVWLNGLFPISPTSLAVTGTGSSASTNDRCQTTFTSCATLSLNGIFSGSYDNYVITINTTCSLSGAYNFTFRLRSAGTDSTTTYNHQALYVGGGTISGGRATSQTAGRFGEIASNIRNAHTVFVFGPFLALPTLARTIDANSEGNATIYEVVQYHSSSTSYDGITFIPEGSGNTISGLVTVFGFNQ